MQMSAGGGETPGGGASGAFWKGSEPRARTPRPERAGSLGVRLSSPGFLLYPSPRQPGGTDTHSGDAAPSFPAPAWLFLCHRDHENKARGGGAGTGRLRGALPPAPAPGAQTILPSQPPERQVSTKLCRRCRVYTSLRFCFDLGCAVKPKVLILYDPLHTHTQGTLMWGDKSASGAAGSRYGNNSSIWKSSQSRFE